MTKLCPRGKAAAKRKFKVYPSAYANAYASKICAGKIKDPSGTKRKDFRGPKPAAKGAMMTAGGESAMGRIQKARMMSGGFGIFSKKKNNETNKESNVSKKKKRLKELKEEVSKMRKGGKLTFDEKFKMQEKGLTDKKTGKLIPPHESALKELKTSELKKMTKTGRNPRLGPGKGSPESKLEARSFLERRKKLSGGKTLLKMAGKVVGRLGLAGAAVVAGATAVKKMMDKKKVDKKKMGGLKAELNNPAKGYMAGGMADYYNDLM